MIAGVNAFHIDIAVIDFVSKRSFQQHLYFNILNWAALHDKKIFLFVVSVFIIQLSVVKVEKTEIIKT